MEKLVKLQAELKATKNREINLVSTTIDHVRIY